MNLLANSKKLETKNMDIIELRDGTAVKYDRLNKEEYLMLLRDAIGGKFSKPFGIEAHWLKDERVLAKGSDYYCLYYSMTDLDKIIEDFANGSSQGNEALMNKNRYGEGFPNNTNAIIKDMLKLLHVRYKEPSEILLMEIDENIEKLKAPEVFIKEHFMNIVAVVGETLIKQNNGAWKMKLGADGVTWNPFITIRKKEYAFFIYLYEDVFLNSSRKKNMLLEIYETMSDIVR